MRKTVAFGFVGTVLDYAGRGSQRWEKWRPTLCLCQQETLVVHRLELLYDARSRSLFEGLKKDIASVSPETEVVGVEIAIRNPWGLRRGLRLPARFRPQPYFSSRR
ncbi:response regulator [Salmonella enterica subsp. enterica]|uniref:Response regulator n=1 Tax=Salmonella enterica I TaxID=59201 RepID=A0A3S4HR80_SALET|nr:response regulator [Salmonella enterica subsp. enterica]